MITNIPDPNSFKEQGVTFLNLAWEYVTNAVFGAEKAEPHKGSQNYWRNAQPLLLTSIALIQQGTELLLKGKIAEVSPFFLIMGHPRNWPRRCASRDVDFIEFRTLDAQDLIRVYNTVMSVRLSDTFMSRYDEMRKLRNIIFHTVSQSIQVEIKNIVMTILEITQSLIEARKWLHIRREYFKKSPKSLELGYKERQDQLMQETAFIINLLDNVSCTNYIGFNKNEVSYICPTCAFAISPLYLVHPIHHGAAERLNEFKKERRIAFSQFLPNSHKYDKLWCFCCSKSIEVEKSPCKHEKCDGDVLYYKKKGEAMCLMCLLNQY